MAAHATTMVATSASAAHAAASEAQAWEAVVCVHARMMYRIAFAVLRRHEDAEDTVQETLKRAWKYRARLAVVENPAAWLARIAWRVAKSRRSRPGVVAIEELPELQQLRAAGATAEQLAADRQMQVLVERHVQHLPVKLRHALVLSTVHELSAREVGAILGIPEASVRTRCLRARRLLREKLQVSLEAHHAPRP